MNRRNLFRSLGLAAAVGAIAALPKLPAKASEEPKIIAQPHVEPARVGQAVVGRSVTMQTTTSGTHNLPIYFNGGNWLPVTVSDANSYIINVAGAAGITPMIYSLI